MADNIVKQPSECTTMSEVRAGVDATDRALMKLLATRFAYMHTAARIKPERTHVRDEERKAAVIAAAVKDAADHCVPTELIAQMWDDLVEASIAYEMTEWDNLRQR